MAEEKTPFRITTPILGAEVGDELGTQISHVNLNKGVHRSRYVEKDGPVIFEYDDELDFQELTPLKGSATEAVIKKAAAEKRKSAIAAVVEWGRSWISHLSGSIRKAQEDDARRTYELKEVHLGEDPGTLTQERYDTYLKQREADQKLAAYIQKRDREEKK